MIGWTGAGLPIISPEIGWVMTGILKTLVVRASQNNLNLTYDVDPDIPDPLIGDSLRLRQVITNLVGNAIKFTPSKVTRKGHVALSCRLVSIEEGTVKLEFCVMDTGIGIAKDKLNMIFDTFCQADGSTTRVRVFFFPPSLSPFFFPSSSSPSLLPNIPAPVLISNAKSL